MARGVATSLPLSRDALRAAYNYLNETPPFNRWNLPDGDDVGFRVVKDQSIYGWHRLDGDKNTIGISAAKVGHTASLMFVMAHEMIHLHERRQCPGATGHSAAFQRWAAQVCLIHGFDPKGF